MPRGDGSDDSKAQTAPPPPQTRGRPPLSHEVEPLQRAVFRKSKQSGKGRTGAGQQPSQSASPPEELYYPSIFRYTCRGKFHANSKNEQSEAAGVCTGIQSQLEHVEHWRLVTRSQAIDGFRTQVGSNNFNNSQAEFDLDGSRGGSGAGPSAVGGGAMSDVNMGGDAAEAHAVQSALLSPIIVYPPAPRAPPQPNEEDETRKRKDSKIRNASTTTTTASTELIENQDWSCYGTTEIDLLVLRKQNETDEEIAAIAPFCSPGLSNRDVTGYWGKDRTSTMRLGFVEIVYQSSLSPEEVLEEEEERGSSSTQQGVPGAAEGTPAKNAGKLFDIDSIFAFPERWIAQSSKIVQHMEINAKMLKDAVSDDFPNRTYQAGKRILDEFGKTVDRTTSLMRQLWDDDDDDDNGPSSGRGPPPRRG